MDFGFWMMNFGLVDCGAAAVAILLRALRLRRDKVTGGGCELFDAAQ
jgi:hypothetical protein